MPAVSAREIVARRASTIGSVPPGERSYVCDCCLGPVFSMYSECYGCKRLFADAPPILRGRVVPMSTANNPSPWYTEILEFKRGARESQTLVAALIAAFIASHTQRLEALLGGPFTQVAVVPSTRGRRFEDHPVTRAGNWIVRVKERLSSALSHTPGATVARQEYKPRAFSVDAPSVNGGRILLLEDLWVSGAKAVSAAGALLEAGATSVVILPVAREYRFPGPYCPDEYSGDATVPYDVDHWPLP